MFYRGALRKIDPRNLRAIIETKDRLKDPDFDAVMLAKDLQVSKESLDSYFSEHFSCSAEDYIDFKRLERLIKNSSGMNFEENAVFLFGIIFSHGFNSLISLNNVIEKFERYSMKSKFNYEEQTIRHYKQYIHHLFTMK